MTLVTAGFPAGFLKSPPTIAASIRADDNTPQERHGMNNDNKHPSSRLVISPRADDRPPARPAQPPSRALVDRRKGDRRRPRGAEESGIWRTIALAAGPALWINFFSKEVVINGRRITLTPKEFDLLSLLAAQPGRVYSDDEILQSLWGDSDSATTAHIAQYVHRLRKKLGDDPAAPRCLVNVKRFGYKLNCDPAAHATGSPATP